MIHRRSSGEFSPSATPLFAPGPARPHLPLPLFIGTLSEEPVHHGTLRLCRVLLKYIPFCPLTLDPHDR
jgi:hypothetical protein